MQNYRGWQRGPGERYLRYTNEGNLPGRHGLIPAASGTGTAAVLVTVQGAKDVKSMLVAQCGGGLGEHLGTARGQCSAEALATKTNDAEQSHEGFRV